MGIGPTSRGLVRIGVIAASADSLLPLGVLFGLCRLAASAVSHIRIFGFAFGVGSSFGCAGLVFRLVPRKRHTAPALLN